MQKRKLVVIQFSTLDGVVQGPGGKDEDTSGGFEAGGWQMNFPDDGEYHPVPEEVSKAGALLLGRKTYDNFADYWPTRGKDVEWFGPFMNNIPKYVASKTLKTVEWKNSTLLKGDTAKAVAQLKAEAGKDIYMFGSGDFCQTLIRENLIDEYFLMIYPMTLGKGKRLFQPTSAKQNLELTRSRISKTGVLMLNYKVINS